MHRSLTLLGTVAATVGLLAVAATVPLAGASSHREAPAISKDPSADNTDVYAFVSPDKPDTVTLVANYIPAEEPAGGPNFYEWDPSVLYEIHIYNGAPHTPTVVQHAAPNVQPTAQPNAEHAAPSAQPSMEHAVPNVEPAVEHAAPTAQHSMEHAVPNVEPAVEHAAPTTQPSLEHAVPDVEHATPAAQPNAEQAAASVQSTEGANNEITYQFRFHTKVVNPDTFLYNVGPITFDGTKYVNWNRPQTYSLTRVDENGTSQPMLTEGLVPPVNIGPRSTPFYDQLARAAIGDLPNGGKVFAGQRDDPFFVDLGSVFDLLGLRPFNAAHKVPCPDPTSPCPTMNGVDDLAGLSVHSIVLQVPKSDLTHSHMAPTDPNDPNSIIGVYASASRKSTRVLDDSNNDDNSTGQWVQVSRLGEPLINEVLIPMGKKDRWNASNPVQDQQFQQYYLSPEPARLINSLYQGTVTPIDESGRTDLVAILLTGLKLPAGNPTGVTNFTFTGDRPMDLVRLNMAVAPTAAVGSGNALGVLAGDLAGFPNGRRLEDDVVDIEIRAIAQGYGDVVSKITGLPNKSPNNSLGDGVNQNSVGDAANLKGFLTAFPYERNPKSGYDPTNHVVDGTPPPLP